MSLVPTRIPGIFRKLAGGRCFTSVMGIGKRCGLLLPRKNREIRRRVVVSGQWKVESVVATQSEHKREGICELGENLQI